MFTALGDCRYGPDFFQNTVIVVSGESARQKFFTARGLDLNEGFKMLSGAVSLIHPILA